MKKQFLTNKFISFPQDLICSSIRINQEEKECEKNQKITKNQHKKEEMHPKFMENTMEGLELSLEIDDNKDNFLELMRSKSAHQIIKQQKQQLSKFKDQKSGYAASLFNTNSFDQLTMNISHTANQHNLSNILGSDQQPNQSKSKVLQKPSKIQTFQQNHYNETAIINAHKQKNVNTPISSFNYKSSKNHQLNFKNMTKINQQLKYSIAETSRQEADEAVGLIYEQPHLITPQLKQLCSDNNLETQRQKNRLQVGGNFPNKLKKYTSLQGEKVAQKKLTLRDYIYLQKLQVKNRDKTAQTSQKQIFLKEPSSPLTPSTPNSPALSISRKKKVQSSNCQVLKLMKLEIIQNIKIIQDRLIQAQQYVSNYEESELADHDDIMKLYNLGRIIKDRMLIGNKEIASFLKMHRI